MSAEDIRNSEAKDLQYSYDEMLDDCYTDYIIGGIAFTASAVLKKCDGIAYQCGLNDWISDIKEPWRCGRCGDVHVTEEAAEVCCQEEA